MLNGLIKVLDNLFSIKTCVGLLLTCCSFQSICAARPDSTNAAVTFVSPDSAFSMGVARVNGEILISLSFNHDITFDYLSIEREVSFETSFSQCKYVTYDEVKAKKWFIIKRDRYPYSAQTGIYYRVKYVTKDGVMRIFPSLYLSEVK